VTNAPAMCFHAGLDVPTAIIMGRQSLIAILQWYLHGTRCFSCVLFSDLWQRMLWGHWYSCKH